MARFADLMGAIVMLGLGGCVATSPDWDARFGDSAATLAAQQVIAPNASRNVDPVKGIDGKAAEGAMGEYTKSYAQPPHLPDAFRITVGGGSGR